MRADPAIDSLKVKGYVVLLCVRVRRVSVCIHDVRMDCLALDGTVQYDVSLARSINTVVTTYTCTHGRYIRAKGLLQSSASLCIFFTIKHNQVGIEREAEGEEQEGKEEETSNRNLYQQNSMQRTALTSFLTKLGLLVYFLLSATIKADDSIEIMSSCSDDPFETLDRAKISYQVPDDVAASIGYPDLYAVNEDCYKCAKTLVASGTGTGGDVYNCASIWTPFGWTFYLMDPATGEQLAKKKYAPGERGEYVITAGTSSLNIHEEVSPMNSYIPLWTLFGILVGIALLSYMVPVLVAKYKARNDEALGAEFNEALVQQPNTDASDLDQDHPSVKAGTQPKKRARVIALDTFRGFSLCVMIFVNYGGGGYYFFEHSSWNGLTVADLLFPWFMWMMGVSMALSFSSMLPRADTAESQQEMRNRNEKAAVNKSKLWYHVVKRTIILFGLGLFLNDGFYYNNWRIPGVLQYFAISYFVTSATVLLLYPFTQARLQLIHDQLSAEAHFSEYSSKHNHQQESGGGGVGRHEHRTQSLPYRMLCCMCGKGIYTPFYLRAYWLEWTVQAFILGLYLFITLGLSAPGCPVGYSGPGGISENGDHKDCTGGIHRYVDMKVFGYKHFYHEPTCIQLYQCIPYDPEGLLGAMGACTLTYLGLMAGRVLLHYKEHAERLRTWLLGATLQCLLGAILCGFSQNDGLIPVNKNLWSVSFVFVTAGGGLLGLSCCYVLIDVFNIWSGAPFLYLGMNSILFYCAHEVFEEYMPFSYNVTDIKHGPILLMNCIGVFAWMVLAYYCYKIKFFVKI